VAQGVARVENVYGVAVTAEGNRLARCCLEDAFEPAAAAWRGLGTIPGSGLALRPEYSRFDAALRLGLDLADDGEAPGCRCGDVICGRIAPRDCPRFGVTCTPARPAGPCMVSSEGTCAAYARYGRQ
jgi:hydrogenase expression/formation protein HypD